MRNTYLILNGCGSWPGKVLVLLQVAHPYEYRSIFPLVRDLHPFFFPFYFFIALWFWIVFILSHPLRKWWWCWLLKFNFLARNRCPVIWYKIYDTALDQYLNRTSHSSGLPVPIFFVCSKLETWCGIRSDRDPTKSWSWKTPYQRNPRVHTHTHHHPHHNNCIDLLYSKNFWPTLHLLPHNFSTNYLMIAIFDKQENR